MRKYNYLLTISLAVFLLFFSITDASAKIVTFEKEYTYQASEIDSKVSSRAIALEQVKRLLLEEIGVYLISETEVKDFKLTKDQVTVLTAGIVSAEILQEKWDGATYYMKAKISADPDEVAKSVKTLGADKQKTKELEDSRKKAKDALEEIERLKKEIAGLKQSTKQQKEYATAVKELSATDWFDKGYAFSESGNHKEAINAYNKVIGLEPQDADAYNNRGTAYGYLGNYQQAINDYNKAIQLNPEYVKAYSNRGAVYAYLGNYQQAINDDNKAIQLDPQYAKAYYNRGVAYSGLGNYQQAINDYNKAIELNPQHALAYYNRGVAYARAGDSEHAMNDLNKGYELEPNDQSGHYYSVACMYSVQNKPDKAFAYKQRSNEKGYKNWSWIKKDNDFDNIRNSSCYKEIMAGK
ncbi:MAG: tetratricopeptide repeat protein [Thermodesulfovibrionales bacterium]|nr:tetratricopeptide repeat protein [Thermodesulfovibrionales bacterium]